MTSIFSLRTAYKPYPDFKNVNFQAKSAANIGANMVIKTKIQIYSVILFRDVGATAHRIQNQTFLIQIYIHIGIYLYIYIYIYIEVLRFSWHRMFRLRYSLVLLADTDVSEDRESFIFTVETCRSESKLHCD
jgi:hypothetical protein